LSKDFCASDFGALGWAAGLCDSDWARAMLEIDNSARGSRIRSDFMVILLQKRLDDRCTVLYITITLKHVKRNFVENRHLDENKACLA